MIDRFETWIDCIMAHGPAQIISMARARGQIPILAYHAIGEPERFEEHLKFLLRHSRPLSLDALITACHAVRARPRRAVLLSFDDGDRSLIDVVLPLLKERGIPGVAFVISDLLGSHRLPWWSEVEALLSAGGSSSLLQGVDNALAVPTLKRMSDSYRHRAVKELRLSSSSVATNPEQLTQADLRALEAAGISIGNHTNTHACLPRCSRTKVESEIRDAHSKLESALGHPPKSFAYPNGDWDPRAETVLTELGYEAAFLFDHRTNRLPISNPFRISRVRVDATTSMDRYRMIVSGLHPTLHRLRGGK
jgi:peptidoglycan/xylan/chitin deacetylase (PgdA/CDA1 family)